MKKTDKIVVLMGGMSSERDISLQSGQSVVQALSDAGYHVTGVDLTEDIDAFIRQLKHLKPDVVFNALHGKYGEDGSIQGLLNLMNIPYTHSGVLASALGMDKRLTKRIVKSLGIFVADELFVSKKEIESGHELKMPYVVKPNDEGSSVGLFIVKSDKDRAQMLKKWPFGNKRVLMEAYIPGRELSVAVLNGQAVGTVEITTDTGVYDYKNKYQSSATKHLVPAPLNEKTDRLVRQQAEYIHRVLGCRGVSRSDFRLNGDKLFFLEVNTSPGMTDKSLVPDMAQCQNMSYLDVILALLKEATCD